MTHLVELLSHADPIAAGFAQLTVWASRAVAEQVPAAQWLDVRTAPALGAGLRARTWWQLTQLGPWCESNADLLFVPGGLYTGRFRPYVTMCRNMLPFDRESAARYGVSRMRARLRVLRPLQARSFRSASGVVFLTEHARRHVEQTTGPISKAAIIPHGVAARFRNPPARQRPIGEYSETSPFRWLYVSIIDVYKHQVEVAQAIAALRRSGLPVTIDLVGPAYAPAFRRLKQCMLHLDPDGAFLRHVPAVAHSQLSELYRDADAFVFASSCENLPNVLLEAMAAGMPIACSSRAPMPEILGEGGEYFEPTDAASIERALLRLTTDSQRRQRIAAAGFERARAYNWDMCARDTFDFLYHTALASR